MPHPPARIRPYAPADGPLLERLLIQTWAGDETATHFYRYGEAPVGSERYIRTLVAEGAGRPMGFGSLWHNRFHPYTLYCGINVHPAWQGQGVGRALLAALMQGRPDDRPLQTATWESHPRSLRFLAAAGFSPVRRTYAPILPVAAVDQDAYGAAASCAAAGYRIVTLADLACDPAKRDVIAALCAEIYTATHQVNPPGPFSSAQWQETVFGQPLVLAGSFAMLRADEVAGVALLHPADEPGTLELGWRGVGQHHQEQMQALIIALTLAQVEWAAAHGFVTLQAEVDSTDPYAWLMLDALPFQPAPAWVTYRL